MIAKKRLNKIIKKGDKVIAISGNNRGQTGIVLSRIGDKAVVQGLNVRKKHIKASQANPKGGIVELERAIHISNLSVCTDDDKPVKLKVRTGENGERELYYKIDGDQEVVYRSIKHS